MSNKTISINPNLFSSGSIKTKKNREKKPVLPAPLISPNVLKNKLLKRIKEHKQRESDNLENNIKSKIEIPDKTNDISAFSDEFNESINYLQTLSKQKKINDEKNNYELQKQKRREELERRTLKNYHTSGSNSGIQQPYVNLDLPEELQTTFTYSQGTPMSINNPQTKDQIPYGILKGGTKPTYRDWSRTQRTNVVTNPNLALTIEGREMNMAKNERENRLNSLREKLKRKQLEETLQRQQDIMMTQNLIKPPPPIQPSISEEMLPQGSQNIITVPHNTANNNMTHATSIQSISSTPSPITITNGLPQQNNAYSENLYNPVGPEERVVGMKRIIKKTIKRKYTLGKSKIKKTVSVLVKDRGTRKNIINAQKDLKRKPLTEVKNYLRDHNLIKIGSNAPNDVIRKLYETAMLAGEITNSNSETLMHNFTKLDKEL